ncbi:MAG: class I SAM-dependent RNA methyltransferase [Sandaracinaceae bacterium]
MSIFVTAAAGTEKPLKAELREIGVRGIKGDRGGVHVHDDDPMTAARICLGSRVGIRVMRQIASFPCPEGDALYEGVRDIEWERWLTIDRTLSVSAVSKHPTLNHTQFIAQRTKDGVVDRQRKRGGARSDVNRRDPDVAVFVRLEKNRANIYLDASGRSLHQRGWRKEAGEAPLKETLAAALVGLSGWDRECTLLDPLAGSGTIPIEADLWARRVPPQPAGRRFGFERWADFDEAAAGEMKRLREAVAARTLDAGPRCLGSDRDAEVLAIARGNATQAGSEARFRPSDIRDLPPPSGEPCQIVTNPPFGERLETDIQFWQALPSMLEDLGAKRISVLVPDDAPSRMPRHARTHPVFNGKIRCQLVTWDVGAE